MIWTFYELGALICTWWNPFIFLLLHKPQCGKPMSEHSTLCTWNQRALLRSKVRLMATHMPTCHLYPICSFMKHLLIIWQWLGPTCINKMKILLFQSMWSVGDVNFQICSKPWTVCSYLASKGSGLGEDLWRELCSFPRHHPSLWGKLETAWRGCPGVWSVPGRSKKGVPMSWERDKMPFPPQPAQILCFL